MYSLTDPGLPYGPPTESIGRGFRKTYEHRTSLAGTKIDLINIKYRVKDAYKNLITNY